MSLNKLHPHKAKPKKSEKGMAVLEAIPVLFMMVLVFNFTLGFFGAIHSGILNSIASYNYTLETFRFRSNLVYFRPGGDTTNYFKSQNRVHGTVQDGTAATSDNKVEDKRWPATLRGITFNYDSDNQARSLASVQDSKGGKTATNDSAVDRLFKMVPTPGNIWYVKAKSVPQAGETPVQTARVWVKTVYGICLNADCKPKN